MSASTGKRSSRRPAGTDQSTGPTAERPALAEPRQRLVARLIDTLIVGPPVALVARALLPESAYGARPAETVTAIGVAVLYLLYDTVQHALWGRTIGKRLTGVRVVRTAAQSVQGRVELPWALLRAAIFALPIAARPVPILGVVAGIFWVANAAWVLRSANRQAVHDGLAGTAVIRTGVIRTGPAPFSPS